MRPFDASSREEVSGFSRYMRTVYGRDIPVKVRVLWDRHTGDVKYRVRWKLGRRI